ncbi:MAG: hypothetical protein M3P49_11930, partial [Actinomycetota bacterium]|nr:hypothetical protein [Actinomycetota bacterium]
RETVEAAEKLIRGSGEKWTTNKAVSEELGVDKAAASRRVGTAINRGYLKNLEESKGRPARLVIGEPMPEDQEILPTAEELGRASSGCAVDRESEGVTHPSSPTGGDNDESGGGGAYPPRDNASTDQRSGEDEARERFAL